MSKSAATKYTLQSVSKLAEKARKLLTINPETNIGTPVVGTFRTPPPGSRVEKYQTPESKASDLAENQYYNRDARRNYPRTSVFTQQDISGLLIAGSVAKPLPPTTSTETGLTLKDITTKSLSKILEVQKPRFNSSTLPPMAPSLIKPTWSFSSAQEYNGDIINYK